MSILVIMGAMTLLSAPFEAVNPRPRVRVYRKKDKRKSPHTFHSREL